MPATVCKRVVVLVVEVSWEQTRGLRQRILGWPGDPVPGDQDRGTVHLAVLGVQGAPVAAVSTCPHPCPERPGIPATYLWAMAVADDYQRQGIGGQLISELTRRSTAGGRTVLWADARASAVGFYLACGAMAVGEPMRDPITGLEDSRIVFDLKHRP